MEDKLGEQKNIISKNNKEAISELPEEVFKAVDQDVELAGGEWKAPPEFEGAIGFTMFDSPASEDNTVIVLQTKEDLGKAPSQAIVRIKTFLMDDHIWALL